MNERTENTVKFDIVNLYKINEFGEYLAPVSLMRVVEEIGKAYKFRADGFCRLVFDDKTINNAYHKSTLTKHDTLLFICNFSDNTLQIYIFVYEPEKQGVLLVTVFNSIDKRILLSSQYINEESYLKRLPLKDVTTILQVAYHASDKLTFKTKIIKPNDK